MARVSDLNPDLCLLTKISDPDPGLLTRVSDLDPNNGIVPSVKM